MRLRVLQPVKDHLETGRLRFPSLLLARLLISLASVLSRRGIESSLRCLLDPASTRQTQQLPGTSEKVNFGDSRSTKSRRGPSRELSCGPASTVIWACMS